MSTILSSSELLKRALSYIEEELRRNPDAGVNKLMDEAGMRFNLSPRDSEALLRIFSSGTAKDRKPPS